MSARRERNDGRLDRLGFGCVKLGGLAKTDGRRGAVGLVQAAVDAGVTFFDTADAYGSGTSERILGAALGTRRDRVIIATKGGYLFRERGSFEQSARRVAAPLVAAVKERRSSNGRGVPSAPISGAAYAAQDFSPAHLRYAVESSLRRLRTDRIDIYQLHGPASVCPPETLEVMDDLVRSGKVVEFGVGLEQLDRAVEWLSVQSLSRMQLPFGILDPQARADIFPAASVHDVRLIVRGIFGSGLFGSVRSSGEGDPNDAKIRFVDELRDLAREHGVTAHQLAVWWVLAQPVADTILIGINSIDHLRSTVGFMESPRPEDALVQRIDAMIAERVIVPPG